MFGILYSIYTLLGITGHNIKEKYYADKRKTDAINKCNDTYTDSKGKTRYIKNDRWVCYANVNGHKVLKDCMNNNVYIDYTECNQINNQKINKVKAQESDKTVYLYMEERDVDKMDPWKGHRYKDLETGSIYVIRKCLVNMMYNDWCEFYVDISNGMYVRKTDNQIIKDKRWYSKISEIQKKYSDDPTELNRKIKFLNTRFINDDNVEDFINKLNEKQIKYKSDNDSLYYGIRV